MLRTMVKENLRYIYLMLLPPLAAFFERSKEIHRDYALMVLPLMLGVMIIHWTLPPPLYALVFGLFIVYFAVVTLACAYFERLCWDEVKRLGVDLA